MAQVSDKQAEMLRAGKHFGVVGTIGADGRPQTSVVWVDWDGENVVFNTTNKRAKGRNLRRNPRVSISVWDNDDP
jgi:PPOX class probable F420-dependent enzyme